jgi:hypothetical protein
LGSIPCLEKLSTSAKNLRCFFWLYWMVLDNGWVTRWSTVLELDRGFGWQEHVRFFWRVCNTLRSHSPHILLYRFIELGLVKESHFLHDN